MAYRSKIASRKGATQEYELHIHTNPLLTPRIRLDGNDYIAPLTADSLKPKSKWLIVRDNMHKIRTWGPVDTSNVDPRCRDWYVFFQMRRELRSAQVRIRQIENRPDFVPVRTFALPINAEEKSTQYNVSHIKTSDAIFYPRLGAEPIVLQSLLYYFSKECAVPYRSVFREFLSDVCSVVNRDRQRLDRVVFLRRIAFIITLIVFIIIALMFLSLIVSVFTTTSKLSYMLQNDNDGNIAWTQSPTI